MKIKHMLLVLMPLCLASCSEEETVVSAGNQREVLVTAGIGTHSRMVLNDKGQYTESLWQNGDEISLFTSTQSNLVYSTSLDSISASASFTATGESLQYIEENQVYACYPSVTEVEGDSLVVNLPATGSLDYNEGTVRSFCYAVDKISKGSLNFKFKHLSAFLSLTVTSEMLGDKSLNHGKVTVSTSSSAPLSVGEGDTFDFTTLQASTTNGSNSVVVNVNQHVSDSLWTVYIPVLPQPSGADITITLADSEGTTIYTQTKRTPASGFLSGNVYKLNTSDSFEVAYLVDGPTFNQSIKELINGGLNPDDYSVGKIRFVTESYQVPERHVVVSSESSSVPIYASFNQADSLLTISTAAKRMEIEDASYMFYNLKSLRIIDFGNFGINETTINTFLMFGNCSSLTTLDVSKWNTSQIVYMSGMFLGCSSLSSLDVSVWNTSQVTNMSSMFLGCSSLSSLNVSNWETGQVTNMSGMFDNCSSLTTLDVSAWNTGQVTNMSGMFGYCSSLTTLDISAWETSQVTSMSGMFGDCSSLTALDVSAWDTSRVTDMLCMFFNCSSLTALDVLTWNTGQVTNMSCMFEGCSSLSSLDLSKWNTGQVINMSGMFDECSSLSTLNVSAWDTGQVTNMLGMFYNCSSLTTLDLSTWNVNLVTDMSGMFYNCSSLTMLSLLDWNFNANMIINSMFENCASTSQACKVASTQETKEFLLSNIETTQMNPDWFIWEVDGEVPEVAYLVDGPTFNERIKLLADQETNLNNEEGYYNEYIRKVKFITEVQALSDECVMVSADNSPVPIYASFNKADSLLTVVTSAKGIEIVDASQMFGGLISLFDIDFGNFNINERTMDLYAMFSGCSSLAALDVSNWNTSNVTNMKNLFACCSSLTNLDVTNWDTSNVTCMNDLFAGCTSLIALDVSNWNTIKVTDMSDVFVDCSSLTTLAVSNWNTNNVIYMSGVFSGCSSLTALDVSKWDTNNVTEMYAMFSGCSSLATLNIADWNFNENVEVTSMFTDCASISQACRITATQENKEFLLGKTETTEMNPAWFIWGDAANDGSAFDDIPKEEW